MASLDKIIQDIEEMVNNPSEHDYEDQGYQMALDSLEYLKQYKEVKEEYKKRLSILRDVLFETEENESIPWEFLKLQKGKPVWIQFMGQYEYLSRWVIVTRLEKDKICFTASDGVDGYNGFCYKRDMGKKWIAYHREVKNENI